MEGARGRAVGAVQEAAAQGLPHLSRNRRPAFFSLEWPRRCGPQCVAPPPRAHQMSILENSRLQIHRPADHTLPQLVLKLAATRRPEASRISRASMTRK